jgi:16S rRNA (adenine1518-N6/adenine1519-N6)-dimethyltransferase
MEAMRECRRSVLYPCPSVSIRGFPMKLSEMRELLGARGIQLTKSLGQNFLHDQNQLQRIARAGELTKNDRVLEIGPGLGPLTELLIEQSGHVLAVEKDARLLPVLRERFGAVPALELQHADALDIVRDHTRDWADWKLVANLPYSVASPILVELAQNPRRPERLVATLQLEVARRLMARSGDDDYGLLTLLVQLRYHPRELYKVPRGCFFPEPDVDSACIVLIRRATPLLEEPLHPQFERVVKSALSQRRKKMSKLLKAQWPDDLIARSIAALGLPADVRGEKLSLEQFVALTKSLAGK